MEMRKEKGREGDGDEARQNGTGARERLNLVKH
jgi:hypothetical protein